MIIITQGVITERASRIEIGSGLAVTQVLVGGDYVTKIDTAAAFGITQEQADIRYVQKTGDTMSGLLTLNAAVALVANGQVDVNGLLRATATTQQFTARYDTSNRFDLTVGATGIVTMAAAGASGQFSFSQLVTVPAFTATGTVTFTGSNVILQNTVPRLRFQDTDGTVNKRVIDIAYYGDRITFEARNDAASWLRDLIYILHDGGLTVPGLITASNGVFFGTSAASNIGSISNNPTDGMQLRGVTGSSYDFVIATPGGSYVARVPTGTVTMTFLGDVVGGGNVGFSVNSASTFRLDAVNTGTGQVGWRLNRTGGVASNWEGYVPLGSTEFRLYNAGDKFIFSTAGLFTAGGGLTFTGTITGSGGAGITFDTNSAASIVFKSNTTTRMTMTTAGALVMATGFLGDTAAVVATVGGSALQWGHPNGAYSSNSIGALWSAGYPYIMFHAYQDAGGTDLFRRGGATTYPAMWRFHSELGTLDWMTNTALGTADALVTLSSVFSIGRDGAVIASGRFSNTYAVADDNSAAFSNSHASGYGLFTRGGSASRYVAHFTTYNDVSAFAIYSDKVILPVGNPIYFDGGSNTYMREISADVIQFVIGGAEGARIAAAGITAPNLIFA